MHSLVAQHALGGSEPVVQTVGTVTIAENSGVALASVAARRGCEHACEDILKDILGAVPTVGRAVLHDPEAGFWTGPDQWMLGAPMATHEDLADRLLGRFGAAASVTEQSGAWVCFDVTGAKMPDVMERLSAVPVRTMLAGDARRTTLHHIGCFVIRRQADDHVRILGPRSSAGSLHHALVTAALSVA